MYVLFDLSKQNFIRLALFDLQNMTRVEEKGGNGELLFVLDSLLDKEGLRRSDIEGIMVVLGSGSFTSTRISAVVANVFSYIQKIPVMGIRQEQTDMVQDLISELLRRSAGEYISASYSAEPNIGL